MRRCTSVIAGLLASVAAASIATTAFARTADEAAAANEVPGGVSETADGDSQTDPATGAQAQAAQPGPDALDGEIVVTAQRRSELLSRVPISVSAYSDETMDRLGVRTIDDIARLTPGVTVSGSGSNVDITIRGIRATFSSPTTAVFIDDTPIQAHAKGYGSFGSSYPQVFDLERVEILRGPQGTLFGGSAQGGAIRFITPQPSLVDTSVYGRAEVSNTAHGDISYEGGIAGGTPLIEDVLGLRVSAWHRREGGYIDRTPFNVAEPSSETLEDVNSSRSTVLRAALAFAPLPNLTLTPAIYYQKVKRNDETDFWDSLSDPSSGDFVSGNVVQEKSSDRYFLPTFRADLDLGSVELVSVTSYFDRKVRGQFDLTPLSNSLLTLVASFFDPTFPRQFTAFLPGQMVPSFDNTRQKIFTQEVRLSSTDSGAPLTWTAGVFYSRGRQLEGVFSQDHTLESWFPVEDVFGIGLTDEDYVFTTTVNSLEKELSVFGQADYDFTEELSLTVGARYSSTSFDYVRVVGGPLNYDPSLGTPTKTVAGSKKSKPFTPKVSLNFQADDNNLFYASASKGFRPGGVNEPLFAGCTDIDPAPDYGPDTTWNYEIGSKNRLFGGAVRLEQSIFFIKWTDIQTIVSPGGTCAGASFVDNLGTAESKGFDLQATAQLTDELTVSGAVGYVKATYTKTIDVPEGGTVVQEGDSLPVTPWQLAGFVDYVVPVSAIDGEAYLHADVRYGSHNDNQLSRFIDPGAVGYDPALQLDPAITEVNLRLGARVSDWDVSVFVNNLFDEAPLLGKSHSTEDSPLFFYETVRPRTIGLTATMRR